MSGLRVVWLGIALVLGCPGKRRSGPSGPSTIEPSPKAPGPQLRGSVVDGRYTDLIHGFRIPVPTGWSWTEGPDSGGLLLRVTDPSTGTQIEVWQFTGQDLSPRPRQGCAWTFQDRGPYVGPGGMGLRTIATCVPSNAKAPRIFAWMEPGKRGVWQIEGHVPPGVLIRGTAAVRLLVEQFEQVPEQP